MASKSILAVLKKDHLEVAHLLEQAIVAKSDSKRQVLFTKIKDALTVHTKFEEENLYPVLEEKKSTKDEALEAEEEHALVKHLLQDIGCTNVSDDRWKAKITVLAENVRHHVKEEEQKNGLFDHLKKVLSGEELAELADQYLAMK